MAESDILRYLNGIESQHNGKPRYMAHLAAILEKLDASSGIASDLTDCFKIETAAGKQLDIIGRLVGASRTIAGRALTDDEYRILIYSRIFANHWDGTNEQFKKNWDETLGRIIGALYTDNQDMTVDLIVLGRVDEDILNLLTNPDVVPRPMGVKYNYINRLPDANGRVQIYTGVAMYCSQFQHFSADEAPDFDEEEILADGLGRILYDGFGVVLTC